jgi:hypothetical protein
MIVHSLEKFGGDGIARSGPDDRIDATPGAHCGLFVTDPFGDLARGINCETVEAATKRTFSKFPPVIATMAMCTEMILTKSANREAKFDHAITLLDCDDQITGSYPVIAYSHLCLRFAES